MRVYEFVSHVWAKGYRIPRNTSVRVRLEEGAVKNICGRLDVRGVRIPLGDQPLGKGHLDRNGFLARIIEIKDWSFHRHSAEQTELEAVITKVVNETSQSRGDGGGDQVA